MKKGAYITIATTPRQLDVYVLLNEEPTFGRSAGWRASALIPELRTRPLIFYAWLTDEGTKWIEGSYDEDSPEGQALMAAATLVWSRPLGPIGAAGLPILILKGPP